MKWEVPQKAKLGDTRSVEKFAYLPTRCVGNNYCNTWTHYRVWLEHYIQYQEYKLMVNGDGEPVEEWVKISNDIIAKDKK